MTDEDQPQSARWVPPLGRSPQASLAMSADLPPYVAIDSADAHDVHPAAPAPIGPSAGGYAYLVDSWVASPAPRRGERAGRMLLAVVVMLAIVAGGTFAFVHFTHRDSDSAAATISTGPGLAAVTAMNLQPGDLPGWRAAPAPDSASDNDGLRCPGVVNTGDFMSAEADSATFSLGQARIGSTAAGYSSEAAVQSDIRALQGPKYGQCIQAQLKADAASGKTSRSLGNNAKVSTRPRGGGEPANVVSTINIVSQVSGHPLYGSFVCIASHRIEATVMFISLDRPIDAALAKRLVATVAARVAAA